MGRVVSRIGGVLFEEAQTQLRVDAVLSKLRNPRHNGDGGTPGSG